jgi:hypothetical protein
LQLGCGDGDPLLALQADGLDVHGLDWLADVLAKLLRTAAERSIEGTSGGHDMVSVMACQ